MALPKQKIAVRPDSESKLSELSRKLIREADAADILPTPLDRLLEIAKVTNIDALPDDSFLETLSERMKGFFISAKQKLRGIADLRTRSTFIPPDRNERRMQFAKGHELGHQVIPWHQIDPAYLDDNESLGPNAKGIFEQEANFFSAETIFQGASFRKLARDFQPSFNAVFELADRHGATNQATAWRFVEEQDEAVALALYYPSNALDSHGNSVLTIWRSVGSPEFLRRFGNVDLPLALRTGDPWVAPRDLNCACDGNENLMVDGHSMEFQWMAWWNTYTLLVLLRRKPKLSIVGGILR
ncbi:ImmA/IrrE family metallo-endopeptidase [Bradyrhizobium yuanmingense]|uniref:ImmA/IrrE family metallo-endopeptidase n=1 Tax=Bradyrhizobium yuanmingense TaxID=108015 RepID=UPI0023B88E0C|nr:ImmA/IrrE family metallo-endopeptidase [Bradyrhizobium yuanmingense]MDF0584175.1 ImmA/IrrE family metallo-endopeptidase [Bradyrhizobium yuanmingense]